MTVCMHVLVTESAEFLLPRAGHSDMMACTVPILYGTLHVRGLAVAYWIRRYAIKRNVAASRPHEIFFFQFIYGRTTCSATDSLVYWVDII
jgi:hypothetical protein